MQTINVFFLLIVIDMTLAIICFLCCHAKIKSTINTFPFCLLLTDKASASRVFGGTSYLLAKYFDWETSTGTLSINGSLVDFEL